MEIFKVGDRIVNTQPNSYNSGKRGTLMAITPKFKVIYDDGEHGESSTGEYYKIIKTTNENTMIKTVSNMMKRLLDADTQTLVKAGYINGDLELTCRGLLALQTIIFVQNKAALVESAQADITEAEAQKGN